MIPAKTVLIVGPTATGKSQLALEIAVARRLQIVNCDSLQIYKGLKIGSAMPSREDIKLVPHHLYGYVEKGAQWTAADYVKDVEKLLSLERFEGPPVFCGGSGFYIQALEKGMYEMASIEPKTLAQVTAFIDEKGWPEAYRWILDKDPGLERTVHGNDHYRIRRAMEILMSGSGKPTDLQKKLTPSPLKESQIIKVALYAEKDVLLGRVQKRAQNMLQNGFVEEVEGLIAQGHGDWAPLRSVGYTEVVQFLRGEIREEDLALAISASTMKLIKKQLTWFKRDPATRWFHVDQLSLAKEYVIKALGSD